MVASFYGAVGWSVLLAGLLLWELGGLLFGYPRIGDVISRITRWRWAAYLLFGLWMWVGWHFFIRGWHFFLRR